MSGTTTNFRTQVRTQVRTQDNLLAGSTVQARISPEQKFKEILEQHCKDAEIRYSETNASRMISKMGLEKISQLVKENVLSTGPSGQVSGYLTPLHELLHTNFPKVEEPMPQVPFGHGDHPVPKPSEDPRDLQIVNLLTDTIVFDRSSGSLHKHTGPESES